MTGKTNLKYYKSVFDYVILMLLLSSIINPAKSQEIKLNFPPSCQLNHAMQESRSKELQKIVKSDQVDREGALGSHFKPDVNLPIRDKNRRVRVSEIFAEGCLTTAADYRAAALIFQHGSVSAHYYQAYLWARKAAQIGDPSGWGLAAVALDRYLVANGKQQLFASQFSMRDMAKQCYCMEPVQKNFDEKDRKRYGLMSLAGRYELLTNLNAEKSCGINAECKINRLPLSKNEISRYLSYE